MRLRPLLAVVALLSFVATTDAAAQPSASARNDWRRDVPCTAGARPALVTSPKPAETSLAGCARAFCTTLPGGRRVCSCQKAEENDTGAGDQTLRLEADGRTVREWAADWTFMGPDQFDVLRGDLDADGRDEVVVAQLQGVGNGLGIAYYELTVLDGRDPARAPLHVTVQDFAPGGSFVRPATGGPCRLIATRWQELRDPRRGRGMYLVGQWMRYEDGRLVHDAARPVVVRRLLNSFRRSDTAAAPFAHLRDPRAEARTAGVIADLPPLARRERGTVRGVSGDTVELALASGRTVRYRVLGEPVPAEGDPGPARSAWLVDGATGRAYPAGYAPADARGLAGRAVTVSVYREADDHEVHVIVLAGERRACGTSEGGACR